MFKKSLTRWKLVYSRLMELFMEHIESVDASRIGTTGKCSSAALAMAVAFVSRFETNIQYALKFGYVQKVFNTFETSVFSTHIISVKLTQRNTTR